MALPLCRSFDPGRFDAERAEVIVPPPDEGAGYWAGAPSILRDGDRLFLYCRLRRPRGQTPDRGYECRILASDGGGRFETVWRMEKSEVDSTSVERGCLVRAPGGEFRLYLSYVDPADGRWRTDLLEADHPSRFDAARRVPCLTAEGCGCATSQFSGRARCRRFITGLWICHIGLKMRSQC